VFPFEAIAAPYIYPKPVNIDMGCLPDTRVIKKIRQRFKYSRDEYGQRKIEEISQVDLNGDNKCEYYTKGWGGRRRSSPSRVFYDSNGNEIADIEGYEGSFSYGEAKNGYPRILVETWGGGHTNIIYTTNVYSFNGSEYVCEFCTDNSHGGYQDLAKKAYDKKDYELAGIFYWNAYRMFSSRRLSDASNLAVALIKQEKLSQAISLLEKHLAQSDEQITRGEGEPCYIDNCSPSPSRLAKMKSSAYFNLGLANEKAGNAKEAAKNYGIAKRLKSIESGADNHPMNNLSLKARIMYDGELIRNISQEDIAVYLDNDPPRRNLSSNNSTSAYRTEYNNGVYEVYGLKLKPGEHELRVEVDINKNNPLSLYPGDLYRFQKFIVANDVPVELDVNLLKIIHLLKPLDNLNKRSVYGCSHLDDMPVVDSPVSFVWDSVDEAAIYDYKIWDITCLSKSNRMTSQLIEKSSTSKNRFSKNLLESSPRQYYEFSLSAQKNGKKIGSYIGITNFKVGDANKINKEISIGSKSTGLNSTKVLSPSRPEIIILWQGPVGEAAAETLLSKITELGYPSKIAPMTWNRDADLKIYVKTELKERNSYYISEDTKERKDVILTDTSVDITAEDNNSVVLLQQHMMHPFAKRIEEGLDEAARNLVKRELPEFEKKFETALDNLRNH